MASLESIDLSGMNISSVEFFIDLFAGDSKLQTIEGLNVYPNEVVVGIQGMFSGCSSLKSISLSNFNTKIWFLCMMFSTDVVL